MNDRDRLEEPPPILRSRGVPPVSRSVKNAPARVWWRRGSDAPADRPPERTSRPIRGRVALGLLALVAIGVQGWTIQRLNTLRSDISAAGTRLEEARGSLAMLWATTNRLDEDQMVRLAMLADSIRSVFAYAQGEIRLWEAAYYAHDQRLRENAARITGNAEALTRLTTGLRAANNRVDDLASAGAAQRSRLEALEREDQAHGSVLDRLAHQAQAQETSLRDVGTAISGLRQNLANLDTELAGLEEQLESSNSAYTQIDTRLERLAGWVDGFRRAGLSAEAVQGRLTALADELRRVRLRVDSLRSPMATASPIASPPLRPGPR